MFCRIYFSNTGNQHAIFPLPIHTAAGNKSLLGRRRQRPRHFDHRSKRRSFFLQPSLLSIRLHYYFIDTCFRRKIPRSTLSDRLSKEPSVDTFAEFCGIAGHILTYSRIPATCGYYVCRKCSGLPEPSSPLFLSTSTCPEK